MSSDLIRPSANANPGCPAEPVKRVLSAYPADRVMAHGARRVALLAVGGLSLATGIVGMFVPVLPTTCFLLLAAWCFGRSSPAMYRWMYENRWFGRYLADYRSGRGIPRAIKIGSLSLLWLAIGGTIVFAISAWWLRLLLLAIAAGVTAHVATQRDATGLRDEVRA